MSDRSTFLNEIKNRDPHLGFLIESLFEGIDGVGSQLGVATKGFLQPPDPIKAINVSAGSDHVHVTLHDPSPIRKGVQYFVEWATNPAFAGAHVEDLGASRGKVLPLPAKDGSNNQITYYFRGGSQLHGSKPQPIRAVFGGKYTPTPIVLTGSSKLALLPSQGSGTAPSDGSRPGSFLGTDLQRLPVGPKVPVPPQAR